ncbi:MAG: type III pantothenate kinase [Bacteroidales bacterium]|nr:type III pantothenate kinase [Bacteroidales bacterium]
MFLVIDIGNTRQKVALFDHDGNLVHLEQYAHLLPTDLLSLCSNYELEAAIISSVGEEIQTLIEPLRNQIPIFTFSEDLKLPITLRYGTISTLGTDRIACAVAAQSLYPNQNVLTFQAGTCLVADFVNAQNEYLGGSIAPGLMLRFQSLHNGTHRLPLVEPHPIDFLIGDSTQNSILSGVINGMSAEIDGLIDRYASTFPNLKVIITGGDSELLKSSIKNSIFAAQNLVLNGLYKILYFNVSEV